MTLREKITPQQIDDLRNRRVSGRTLAAILGVGEEWLSRNYSTKKINKIPGPVNAAVIEKRLLAAVRREFRNSIAKDVINGKKNIDDAARQACCTQRTMYRHVKRLREHPNGA